MDWPDAALTTIDCTLMSPAKPVRRRPAVAAVPGKIVKAAKATAASRIAHVAAPATTLRRLSATRATLGPIGKLEDFIPFKLAVVANRVSQSIGHLFETRFDLQIPEWRILMALYAYGRLPFYELVERTSMDKARVSRAQRRLVDLRMIETEVDPGDARKLLLTITTEGARICKRILPEAAAREAWYMAALTEEEHHQLDAILDKLMVRSGEDER